MIQIRPSNIDKFMRKKLRNSHQLYSFDMDLMECYLHGPFDFERNQYTVALSDWETLRSVAPKYDVDISDLGQVIPLK